jgi:AraC-like DNA-binding protein
MSTRPSSAESPAVRLNEYVVPLSNRLDRPAEPLAWWIAMQQPAHPAYDELPGRTLERCLWSRDGVTVFDQRGQYEPFSWTAPWISDHWGVVLPYRGMYWRRCDGVEYVVDVTTGFVQRPGEERAVAVPANRPCDDEVTALEIDQSFLDAVPQLAEARGPLRISSRSELFHRVLRSSIATRADDLTVQSALGDLVWSVVGNGSSRRHLGRPLTAAAHRRMVSQTCELLHVADSRMTLIELARNVAVSPFYLSRIFRRVTGLTVSQYRTRLRVTEVLERITRGEDDLSAIAASTGFADHSHMTRTVVAQFGHTPSSLRTLLRRPGGQPEVSSRTV